MIFIRWDKNFYDKYRYSYGLHLWKITEYYTPLWEIQEPNTRARKLIRIGDDYKISNDNMNDIISFLDDSSFLIIPINLVVIEVPKDLYAVFSNLVRVPDTDYDYCRLRSL